MAPKELKDIKKPKRSVTVRDPAKLDRILTMFKKVTKQ